MSKSLIRILFLVLTIVWLFAVTVAYYIVHKPFSAGGVGSLYDTFANLAKPVAVENPLALLDALANLLITGAIFLFALAAYALDRAVSGFGGYALVPLAALYFQTRTAQVSE